MGDSALKEFLAEVAQAPEPMPGAKDDVGNVVKGGLSVDFYEGAATVAVEVIKAIQTGQLTVRIMDEILWMVAQRHQEACSVSTSS